MTRAGVATVLGGLLALVLGIELNWFVLELLGAGLLLAVVAGLAAVVSPSRLSIERAIQPDRVAKGSPAVAVLTVTNHGRRRSAATTAFQPLGSGEVRTSLPRLRASERGMRIYRLPTRQRGIVDIGPVEVARHVPFDLFRTTQRYGGTDRVWVYPRVVALRALPTGPSPLVRGNSLVHWSLSAHAGHLVVKDTVDTARPYSVVLVDVRPDRYTQGGFEEAVDVAASVLVAAARSGATVGLRLSDGTVLGGPRQRDATPLIDHLITVQADQAASLQTALTALRRTPGTSLIVITGRVDAAELTSVAALRPRFERLVVIGLGTTAVTTLPGVRVIAGVDADAVAQAWNGSVGVSGSTAGRCRGPTGRPAPRMR